MTTVRRMHSHGFRNVAPALTRKLNALLPLNKLLIPLFLLTVVYFSSAAVTRADVVTYNSLQQAGTSLVHIADPYSEGGYRIVNGGELYYAQQSNTLYAASRTHEKN